MDTLKILTIVLPLTLCMTLPSFAESVGLRWDANDPAPEGYRVFVREDGQSYNYDNPVVCVGLETGDIPSEITTVTVAGLVQGVTYHFIVRAFEGELESADSEEVSYTPPIQLTNPKNIKLEEIAL